MQVGAELPRRRILGIGAGGDLPRVFAAGHERGSAHARPCELSSPQHQLHRRPVGADPLRLDVVGDAVPVQSRSELHTHRSSAGDVEHPVQRRRPFVGVRAGGLSSAGRAAGRVEPDAVGAREVGCFGAAVRDGDGVAERSEVVGGDRRGDLIRVHRVDRQAEPGEPERVTADAAPQVGDARQAPGSKPPGVQRRDRHARGLFQARAREQHALGEVAELRFGLRAQPRLTHERRHEVGGVAGRAQGGHLPRDVVGGAHRGHPGEHPQPVGGEQGSQFRRFHSIQRRCSFAAPRAGRSRTRKPPNPGREPRTPNQTPRGSPEVSGGIPDVVTRDRTDY